MLKFLVPALLLFVSSTLQASTHPWHIVTEPFPPYFSPELEGNGWMHDLVVTALERKGISVTIEYVAWSRAMRLTESGGAVAALGAYRTAQREQNFYYSHAIGQTETGFFKKPSLRLSAPFQLDDLSQYVIAKGEEYVVVEGVEEHPGLSFTKTVDLVTSLHMLLGDRVDLVAGTRQVGEHWLRHHPKLTANPASSTIVFIEPAIAKQKMYMIFGKALSGNDKNVQLFNQAMRAFIGSGDLAGLLARHPMPDADRKSITAFLQSHSARQH